MPTGSSQIALRRPFRRWLLWTSTWSAIVLSALVLAQHGPESAVRGTKRFEKSVIVSGLANPWELAWGPDGMLWVTERSGKRVTRVHPATGARRVAVTVDEASAPGGQDGVLGMAFHPELLAGSDHDFVYLAYTYVDEDRPPDPRFTDPKSPHRQLYGKVVRLRYDAAAGTLGDPVDLISGLPASNDHNGMRLAVGPDRTLHLTIGDMGNGQFAHFCNPIRSQRLPTREEIDRQDYSAYQGKTLRLNLDGSIPAGNPELAGVVSHVYTYGHRNPQGIAFGPEGTLYTTDHGPKTDDEVNVLRAGGNYGWPHVAGMRDDKAYEYARWFDSTVPCRTLEFSDHVVPPSVPRDPEWAFQQPLVEPIATLFTVPTGFNFQDPACKGVHFICWPTVGVSSLAHYGGRGDAGIPGWDSVLLLTTLKRGSLYVLPLDPSHQKAGGPIYRFLQTENRYRDVAVHPDGRTLYIATDTGGLVEARDGGATSNIEDPGAILAFRYVGEGDGTEWPVRTTRAEPRGPVVPPGSEVVGPGVPPAFTASQVAAGRTAYDIHCAVCHGTTLTNGTFGTPLAGEYFRWRWSGRSVAALYEKARNTMPPAKPSSLAEETYADILAYILEVNGTGAGDAELPAGGDGLARMRIP
jgi:PQQ-dependent dehydrogenase (s-GDH family)